MRLKLNSQIWISFIFEVAHWIQTTMKAIKNQKCELNMNWFPLNLLRICAQIPMGKVSFSQIIHFVISYFTLINIYLIQIQIYVSQISNFIWISIFQTNTENIMYMSWQNQSLSFDFIQSPTHYWCRRNIVSRIVPEECSLRKVDR